MTVTLRPITPADLPFLLSVYASTRVDEMRLTGWDQPRIDAFIAMQFDLQHRYYSEHYHGARFDVIEVDGEPAGRLYVVDWDTTTRVIDIALLPEFRNRGIGTTLLQDIFERADARGVTVSIHVEANNPARNLYQRLGFRHVSNTNDVYELLERPPVITGEAQR